MILKFDKPRTKFWSFEKKKHKSIEYMKNKNNYNWIIL